MTSINKEQLSEQIAYITINPRGNFLKSAQQGFQNVGLHPKYLLYVKPTDRLWKEFKKYKLSFFGRFLVPQLKRFMGNKKSFSNEVVEIKIPVTKTIPKLNSDELVAFLKENNIKYLINCGAGIFRKKIIDVPGLIILNAHAGKLPEYKNMNVVEWAICNGDTPHGTIHRIDAGIDTGPVWYEEPIDVSSTKSLTEAREYCFDKVIKMMGQAVLKNEEGGITEKKHAPDQGRKWYRMHSFYQKYVDSILNQ